MLTHFLLLNQTGIWGQEKKEKLACQSSGKNCPYAPVFREDHLQRKVHRQRRNNKSDEKKEGLGGEKGREKGACHGVVHRIWDRIGDNRGREERGVKEKKVKTLQRYGSWDGEKESTRRKPPIQKVKLQFPTEKGKGNLRGGKKIQGLFIELRCFLPS